MSDKITVEVVANPNPSFEWNGEPPKPEWQQLVLNTERFFAHVSKHIHSYRFRHEVPDGLVVIIGSDVLVEVSESIPDCLRRPFAELQVGIVAGNPVWFVASITGTAVLPAI